MIYPFRVKVGAYLLEAINAFGLGYYFFYFYFFTAEKYGFDNLQNLLTAALSGFVYIGGAIYGGKLGQRRGYFAALKAGYFLIAVSLGASCFVHGAAAHLVLMSCCTLGMCFTWPNLEAIVSEHESPVALQRMIGIYNLVWAGSMALAFFTGGVIYESELLGELSIFALPAVLAVGQFALTAQMAAWSLGVTRPEPKSESSVEVKAQPLNPRPIARVKAFLQMAWLANPFAYIAINSIVPVIPGLAKKFQLGPMLTGFVCSLLFFARLASFVVLWLWPGWHYRFSWLAGSYIAMVISFAGVLLVQELWMLLVAQVVFGFALGLIYYSSLYYSMDVGTEAKGEHGGIHEAAIGLGLCLGPLLSAGGLYVAPGSPDSGTWAVTVLLVGGLFGLLWLGKRAK